MVLEHALKVLRKMGVMSEDCVTSDSVPYNNCIINGFCKIGGLPVAEEIRAEMAEAGVESNLRTCATLVDGYATQGRLESALRLCDGMERGYTKSGSISGYFKTSDGFVTEERMDLLDIITCNTTINGHFISGMIDPAFVLLREMGEGGISFNIVTYNVLINFLCKFGCIQHAGGLVKVMISRSMVPDFVTYTTLDTNLNKNCSPEEVVTLHDDYMVTKGVIPDRQTYKDIVCPYLLEENSTISTLG